MKFIFYVFFLIPFFLFNFFYIYVYCLFILFFFFFISNFSFGNYFLMSYIFGFDKFSYVFSCFSIWFCILMFYSVNYYSYFFFSKLYLFYLIFLMLFLLCFFMVIDFFYFYFFFEGSLIPVFLIIFGWGYQPERLGAGFYLIFYTLFASLPFFLVIVYVYFFFGGFFFFFDFKFSNYFLMFFILFSFLVSFPLFFFHLWLPKAHVEAPVMGSMILSGVLLSLGGYGIIRSLGFIYFFFFYYGYFFIILSLFGCFYISLFCLIQSDLSVLIAYSSVCHMGLVISGFFTMTFSGVFGSFLFMLGHGFVSSGLFYLSGIIYDRFSSRSIFILSGMINFMPSLSFFWFMFSIMNMSCPPSLNLFSEILIVISLLMWTKFFFFFFFFILFFSACYSMSIFFLTQHGDFCFLSSYIYICCIREYYVLCLHFYPVFFIMFNLSFFFLLI